ncbi:hypothetical protein KP509_17G055600 [Ceratopteris richardii]|uniref:glycerophosphodiester phosphodiesterase n=1 Tax=Ceratopteris richardii TaxID=49495 RepID=A0A8T2SYG9_CERRI|nr:hypothetical protein KP509_17G055600 [Ceratopteris richardii]
MWLLWATDSCPRRDLLLVIPVLTWFATISAVSTSEGVFGSLKISPERVSNTHLEQIQGAASIQRRKIPFPSRRSLAGNESRWNTLDGSAPLVIAHGGSSGIFPDQTIAAYATAAAFSLPTTALFCDLQLTKDAIGICRTGIDLGTSTTINSSFPTLASKYIVNGVLVQGFFSIDLAASLVLQNLTAIQSNLARSPSFDGYFPILQPSDMLTVALNTSLFWINVEYPSFFSEHKLDTSSYILSLMADMPVDFISSPDVAFLKAFKTGAPTATSKLVLKIGGLDEVEVSTNSTYSNLLMNLSTIATYASGILVPKEYIWPVNNETLYLDVETNLIADAHAAGLAVYGYNFVNDASTPTYNYSFDPVREYLQFVPSIGPHIDGFLTDFPSTASESLACFRNVAPTIRPSGAKPYVISHNGDSGNYPGCTMLAYESAVLGGASYIDCPVQITSDGIAICRESPDLLISTDVSTHSNYMNRISSIPDFQDTKGLFSINMTWAEIQTLKARMFSPASDYNIQRNQAYTEEDIITLTDFLNYAQNTSVGILIDVQNGYFLETQVGLNVIGAVLASLNASGLTNSNRVIIQSEDSAVLKLFQELGNYTLVYRVVDTNVLLTKTEASQVKALANFVTLPRGLVQVASQGYLLNKTDIVDIFHAQNISVFVSFLRNEFVTIPYDYDSDPTLELNTLLTVYGVDGVVTDFPATASYYLSNACLNPKTQATADLRYSLRPVIPGDILTNLKPAIQMPLSPPQTPLNVTKGENVLSPTLNRNPSTTLNPGEAPGMSPSPTRSATPAWLRPNIALLTAVLVIIITNHSA